MISLDDEGKDTNPMITVQIPLLFLLSQIPPSELAYHPMQRWTAATIDRAKPMMALDGGGVTMATAGGAGVLEVPCSGVAGVGVMGTMTSG